MKNCVYRFLDKDNNIIYIGKAKNLKNRLNGHNHLSKECYEERKKIEYVSFKNENDMDFAERYFICKESPKYNEVLSNKPISINVTSLDVISWEVYDKETYKKDVAKKNKEKSYVNLNYISVELMELRVKRMAINDFINTGSFNGKHLDVLNKELAKVNLKINDMEKEEMSKLIKSGMSEDLAKIFIEYNTYDKEKIINDKIKNIEDEFCNKCCIDLENIGYYKHEIYKEIDENFIYWSFDSNSKWLLLLEGQKTIKGYKVKTDTKNKLVKQIILNIEKRLNNKFGKLAKDIIILVNNDDYMYGFNPPFEFMEFEKPYIIYRVVNNH